MADVKKAEETASGQKPPASKKAGNIFSPLKPGEYIDRCAWILPNKLQCWKAGEEIVTSTNEKGDETHYQLCERHVRIQKALDAGTLKSEAINTPYKELTIAPPATPAGFEEAKPQEEAEPVKEQPAKEAPKSEKEEEKPKHEGFFHHHTAEGEKKAGG